MSLPGLHVRKCTWLKQNAGHTKRRKLAISVPCWVICASSIRERSISKVLLWSLVKLTGVVYSSASRANTELDQLELEHLDILREDFRSIELLVDGPLLTWQVAFNIPLHYADIPVEVVESQTMWVSQTNIPAAAMAALRRMRLNEARARTVGECVERDDLHIMLLPPSKANICRIIRLLVFARVVCMPLPLAGPTLSFFVYQ